MKNGSLMFLESQINEVTCSSANETNIETNDLYDVEVVSLIDCTPCGLIFEDMGGLEKHLGTFHKKTTRRFNLPSNEGSRPCTLVKHHAVMERNEPQLDERHAHQNGHASSSSQEIAKVQKAVTVINGNGDGRFKTKCTWCYKEFLCGAVDAETMADATGFMCPKCKQKLWGVLENSLINSFQR